MTATLLPTTALFLVLARSRCLPGGTAPLALQEPVTVNQVLHKQVVVISIVAEPVPHVPHVERIEVVDVRGACPGAHRVYCHVGSNASQDAPKATAPALPHLSGVSGCVENDARRFPPGFEVRVTEDRSLVLVHHLYAWLSHSAADGAVVLHLPQNRTIVLGTTVETQGSVPPGDQSQCKGRAWTPSALRGRARRASLTSVTVAVPSTTATIPAVMGMSTP